MAKYFCNPSDSRTVAGKIVTYSRNIFIPLTRNCRNRCAYCGFRSNEPNLMSIDDVRLLLQKGNQAKEALFTFGERPDEAYPEIKKMLLSYQFSDFVEYIETMNRLAIRYGLLPHTNAGILTFSELKRLKPLNASMGLMLEQAVELDCHSMSPGKKPEVRIKMIKNAGRLQIPFTTGILVGIGETPHDREYSLEVIADIHKNYGHIQEVIIQNFSPKKGTPMEGHQPPSAEDMLKTVKAARRILPEDVAIQIPPNLIRNAYIDILPFLKAGANDIGGISTVTHDYVNPESPWPGIEEIRHSLRNEFVLRERLPVYPKFVKLKWYGESLEALVEKYASDDGYARTK
jgi:FO synthase subunit 1